MPHLSTHRSSESIEGLSDAQPGVTETVFMTSRARCAPLIDEPCTSAKWWVWTASRAARGASQLMYNLKQNSRAIVSGSLKIFWI